ncbi:PE family protein, partial [Mycobacterium gordonae]|uniref:PE family protein n=2 Tax=Mycobacterium TaxID=1763 RepID=UPI0021099336
MSSFVIANPELLTAAAADVSQIREALRAASAAAAPWTTGIAPLGGDEVSAAITKLFGGYGQDFHALSARAAVYQAEFVQTLLTGSGAYAAAEAANASPLQVLEQGVLGVVNGPSQLL